MVKLPLKITPRSRHMVGEWVRDHHAPMCRCISMNHMILDISYDHYLYDDDSRMHKYVQDCEQYQYTMAKEMHDMEQRRHQSNVVVRYGVVGKVPNDHALREVFGSFVTDNQGLRWTQDELLDMLKKKAVEVDAVKSALANIEVNAKSFIKKFLQGNETMRFHELLQQYNNYVKDFMTVTDLPQEVLNGRKLVINPDVMPEEEHARRYNRHMGLHEVCVLMADELLPRELEIRLRAPLPGERQTVVVPECSRAHDCLRSRSAIALAVVSSGIATTLLMGGRTFHSRFLASLKPDNTRPFLIAKQSDLAELIRRADLIVWDEVPMSNKYHLEALDITLRDLCNSRMPHKYDTRAKRKTMGNNNTTQYDTDVTSKPGGEHSERSKKSGNGERSLNLRSEHPQDDHHVLGEVERRCSRGNTLDDAENMVVEVGGDDCRADGDGSRRRVEVARSVEVLGVAQWVGAWSGSVGRCWEWLGGRWRESDSGQRRGETGGMYASEAEGGGLGSREGQEGGRGRGCPGERQSNLGRSAEKVVIQRSKRVGGEERSITGDEQELFMVTEKEQEMAERGDMVGDAEAEREETHEEGGQRKSMITTNQDARGGRGRDQNLQTYQRRGKTNVSRKMDETVATTSQGVKKKSPRTKARVLREMRNYFDESEDDSDEVREEVGRLVDAIEKRKGKRRITEGDGRVSALKMRVNKNTSVDVDDASEERTPPTRKREVNSGAGGVEVLKFALEMHQELSAKKAPELKKICGEEGVEWTRKETVINELVRCRTRLAYEGIGGNAASLSGRYSLKNKVTRVVRMRFGTEIRRRPIVRIPFSRRIEAGRVREVMEGIIKQLVQDKQIDKYVAQRTRVVFKRSLTVGQIIHNQWFCAGARRVFCTCREVPWAKAQGHVKVRLDYVPGVPDFVKNSRNMTCGDEVSVDFLRKCIKEAVGTWGKGRRIQVQDQVLMGCYRQQPGMECQAMSGREVREWARMVGGMVAVPIDRNPGGTLVLCPVLYLHVCNMTFNWNASFVPVQRTEEQVIGDMKANYERGSLGKIAAWGKGGRVGRAYVLPKDKDVDRWRPISPASGDPAKLAGARLGRALRHMMFAIGDEKHFDLRATDELRGKCEKIQ
ncbi:hypothetical protein CBR_g51634 [Chara braunii]|uniref:ATP-dependent DNA helicase n=1 Tax=Chara braunii TaxID=69332 RepID=A0A388M8V5_CHABU|nr:hypothetical protein CBR_g51634 [Chara braunii]|eukprot:GBG90976.1 hypothetical protein CBR_g51634 [Chara braunii]